MKEREWYIRIVINSITTLFGVIVLAIAVIMLYQGRMNVTDFSSICTFILGGILLWVKNSVWQSIPNMFKKN